MASYEDVDTIKLPFQSMVKDEVVYASVSAENTKIPEEKIKIQCSFLGFVPLKTVEIQQKELPQVLPGGNTIGIFMKTKGILVVGTGSVTDADGMEREPSLGILKSGDYIVKADGKEISTKASVIQNEINSVVSSYTYEEFRDDQQAVQDEILKNLRTMFDSDFIVSVGFSSVTCQ